MIGEPHIHIHEVESTQLSAFSLVEQGYPSGTVVTADVQTSGRGRAGRSWTSAPGDGLLMSILLRRGAQVESWLSMAVGLAVATALDCWADDVRVKWPNDVLIGDRKIAGILIQTRPYGPDERLVVIGIGVNVATPQERLPVGATSLAVSIPLVPQINDVRQAVCDQLTSVITRVNGAGTGWLAERVTDRLWLMGECVDVVDGDRCHRGIVRGVDTDGALLLDIDGEIQRIFVGDLTRGPVRIAENDHQ